MNRKKHIDQILKESVSNYDRCFAKGDISRPKVYFEIKRFQDSEEPYRGEFEIKKVKFISRNEFIFFGKFLGHTEDAKPYSSCIGYRKFSTPHLADSTDMEKNALKIIAREAKKKNFFNSIILFGLQDSSLGFGPGADDRLRTNITFYTKLIVSNWHMLKNDTVVLKKRKRFYNHEFLKRVGKGFSLSLPFN